MESITSSPPYSAVRDTTVKAVPRRVFDQSPYSDQLVPKDRSRSRPLLPSEQVAACCLEVTVRLYPRMGGDLSGGVGTAGGPVEVVAGRQQIVT
jgi:hypothetical protein